MLPMFVLLWMGCAAGVHILRWDRWARRERLIGRKVVSSSWIYGLVCPETWDPLQCRTRFRVRRRGALYPFLGLSWAPVLKCCVPKTLLHSSSTGVNPMLWKTLDGGWSQEGQIHTTSKYARQEEMKEEILCLTTSSDHWYQFFSYLWCVKS